MSAVTSLCDNKLLNPLWVLSERLEEKIVAVDRCLSQVAYHEISELPDISHHIIGSGGKRLRPLLTLAAAELCGYTDGGRDITLAACIELLHTATLLHDDVIDESKMRRGYPTAHTIWGNQLSILGGDFLFSKMFELLVEDGSLEVLALFVKTTQTLIQGEVLQIKSKFDLGIDEAHYFQAIESKTASLFLAALELGGRIAAADDHKMAALQTYAYNIGIAFQMVDDLLDYTADTAVLGKSVGNDFFEGQVTLPLICVAQAVDSNASLKSKLMDLLLKEERSNEDFQWVQRLLTDYHVVDKLVDRARGFASKAYDALEPMPPHPVKDILLDLTTFVVDRCN